MYRKRGHGGGLIDGDDGWQDWPPETDSAAGSLAEPVLGRSLKRVDAPAARDDLPGAPAHRAPVPVDRSASAPQSAAGTDRAVSEAKPRRRFAKRFALALAVLLALGAGAWYGDYWWTTGRFLVSTDDAYVGAKNATLSAKI